MPPELSGNLRPGAEEKAFQSLETAVFDSIQPFGTTPIIQRCPCTEASESQKKLSDSAQRRAIS